MPCTMPLSHACWYHYCAPPYLLGSCSAPTSVASSPMQSCPVCSCMNSVVIALAQFISWWPVCIKLHHGDVLAVHDSWYPLSNHEYCSGVLAVWGGPLWPVLQSWHHQRVYWQRHKSQPQRGILRCHVRHRIHVRRIMVVDCIVYHGCVMYDRCSSFIVFFSFFFHIFISALLHWHSAAACGPRTTTFMASWHNTSTLIGISLLQLQYDVYNQPFTDDVRD